MSVPQSVADIEVASRLNEPGKNTKIKDQLTGDAAKAAAQGEYYHAQNPNQTTEESLYAEDAVKHPRYPGGVDYEDVATDESELKDVYENTQDFGTVPVDADNFRISHSKRFAHQHNHNQWH